jgi:hypothetical protein
MLRRVLVHPNSQHKNDYDRDPRTLYLLTIQVQSYQIMVKEHVLRFKHFSYVMPLLWASEAT